ncbi:MAG TPA: DapH/DapD/GlmU-related protein [Bacteroidales bacterium]|nr:DapH/DapD/GlmU-related protein [Bacteroidales bacterium]
MIFANITLGSNVEIDPSTSINNVTIKDKTRIAKRCSIYGGPNNILEIGYNGYVGMNSILNGFAEKITIGDYVSISQNVNMMVDSGPNASVSLQRLFPIIKGPIHIGDNCWIGASSIIMPNVILGNYCIVAANSFVNKSFPDFSIIGGTPARLIRTFTQEEKAKVLAGQNNEISSYEDNYLDLPFEDTLRKYRKKNILDTLKTDSHTRFLEIGCGPDPLFQTITEFERMVVVEPGKAFYKMVTPLVDKVDNVLIYNDLIENLTDKLKNENFDVIVIGGFLHEIDNPSEVLYCIRNICRKHTLVYSFVPNAKSFHRLLAHKTGIIKNIYEKSGHDELFNRKNVYDSDTFNKLFINNGFNVLMNGSYFVKPFTHDKMSELLTKKIINDSYLDGLEQMIEYMPDLGSELWNLCTIND